MATRIATVKALEAAKPRASDYYLRCERGLFLRVYPSGRKAFVYRFEVDGKSRKVENARAFGHGPDRISLEQARLWASEQRALRLAGRDPVLAAAGLRSLRRLRLTPSGDYPAGTFGAVAEEFFVRVIAREYRRPGDVRRILDADLLPDLGRRPIKELRLAEVQQSLNKIVDRGSPVAANRALLVAKKVFRYARTQGLIEFNPLGDISRRDVGGKEGERERALTFAELATFWRVIAAHEGLSWQVRGCLQLLVLTGQRIGETLAARWGDVDLKAGTWSMPAENTKSGRAHLVHLSPLALELLESIRGRDGREGARKAQEPLFCADEVDDQPVERRSVTRALDRLQTPPAKNVPAELPIERFTPHDLRRTFRSRLSDLGIAPHVAEKLIAHRLGGVLQIYDRAEYLTERAAAMAAWDAKLRALFADSTGRVTFAPPKDPARKERKQ
jgi:integrase